MNLYITKEMFLLRVNKFRNLIINLGSSYLQIIVSVIMNIMYIPLSIHYLGVERYGVWILLQTFINFLTLANFGVPTAVTNLMCLESDKKVRADIFLKGFEILFKTCLILFVISLFLFYLISNFTLLLSGLSFEVKTASLILMLFFIIRIPFQVSSTVFVAENKIYISKLYEFLVVFFTLGSLLVMIYFKKDLVFLAILSGAVLFFLNIISFVNAMSVLGIKSLRLISNTIVAKTIYKPGLSLFASGMGAVIVWNTDNIIISRFLSLEDVAVYSTAFRLFSFAYMTFGLIYGLIIPYYGKYFSQKEWGKLKNLFILNIIIIPFIAMCVWVVGWLFARDIVFLWLGDYKLYAGSQLYFILGAYGAVLSYVGVMYNFITCLNLLKGLVYLTVSEAVLNLVCSIFLVKFLGINGVAIGTLIASTLVPLVILPSIINSSSKLEFSFPYKLSVLSILFYLTMLFILFIVDANEFIFINKVLIACAYIGLFGFFQFFLNRKLIKDVIQLLKI